MIPHPTAERFRDFAEKQAFRGLNFAICRVRHPFWDTINNGTPVLRRPRADRHHSCTAIKTLQLARLPCPVTYLVSVVFFRVS